MARQWPARDRVTVYPVLTMSCDDESFLVGSDLARFNIRSTGSGAQTVLLGHGMGTDQDVWAAQVPVLAAAGLRVVVFDFAGITPSTAQYFSPGRHRSMHALADDVLAVVQGLGLRDVIYIGHSMGGTAGLLAAEAEPERFQALVTIGASACYLDDPATGYTGGFSLGQVNQLLRSALEDHAQWANGFASTMVGRPSRNLVTDAFCKSLLSLRADVIHAVLGAALRADHRAAVERLHVPFYVLQSRDDAAVPDAAARWLAQHGLARLLIHLRAQGHLPHITAPDEINGALLECLRDIRHG
ncbi:MAG: alpha/beta hydrolase [Steroidobacteraceae bacterium]